MMHKNTTFQLRHQKSRMQILVVVQSAPVQHHTRLTFRSIYSMRRAKLHYRKGAVFPFPAAGHKDKSSQSIDSLAINLEGRAKILFVVPAARPETRKLQLPKNKTTNEIKVSGYRSIQSREAQTVC